MSEKIGWVLHKMLGLVLIFMGFALVILGFSLIIIGSVGLVLPIIPGIPIIFLGLTLIVVGLSFIIGKNRALSLFISQLEKIKLLIEKLIIWLEKRKKLP